MFFRLIFFSLGFTIQATDDDFGEFQKKFPKTYKTEAEKEYRKATFLHNEEIVKQQHQDFLDGKSSWDTQMTEFDDLTEEEFKAHFGIKEFPSIPIDNSVPPPLSSNLPGNVPDSWNWVEQGGVSPVKNQVEIVSRFCTLQHFFAGWLW